jgi:two-component system, NarL family, response regulator DevR
LSSRINVFLIAGNRLFREALSRILRSKSDVNVVGGASCSLDSLVQIEGCGCDVVLIDPANEGGFDGDLLRGVSSAAPLAKTVLIDMVEDETIFMKAIRAGVAGYLLQDASALDVVAAVRAVHGGEAVCPPSLCMALFKHVATLAGATPVPVAKAATRLTRRERQLVPLIGQGLTNKEIASQLNLSEKTVKNHIHRILQRMGVMDRYAAAEMARDRESVGS